MNRAANPHWIGPRRGSYVTVAVTFDRLQEHTRVFHAVIVSPYRARLLFERADDEYRNLFAIDLDPYGEGLTWCYDWDGEGPDALRAAVALR